MLRIFDVITRNFKKMHTVAPLIIVSICTSKGLLV